MRRAARRGRPWPVVCAVCVMFGGCAPDCGDNPSLPPKACIASAVGGPHAADAFEPNDTLALATAPAEHTADCAMTERRATISGAGDVDVFRTGVCDVTDDDAPTAELFTDDPELRLCLILACDVGTTTVFSCADGSDDSTGAGVVAARTEGGFRGCCRSGAGKVVARVQCSGFPFHGHAVNGFIWVDATAGGDAADPDADHDYRVGYRMR